jgi:Sec-independent protein translocase protein TatA
MNILGIGPLEIAFILILVIIIFGPKDLEKAGKTIGKTLYQFIRSDTWKTINQTTREIKNMPNRLMREAGLDELQKMTKEELASIDNTIRLPAGKKPGTESRPAIVPPTKTQQKADPDPLQQIDQIKPQDKEPQE